MSVGYEVGGSVAPGLKGHIPQSEHNGRWKESVTNGHTESWETRPTALCLFTTECASKMNRVSLKENGRSVWN